MIHSVSRVGWIATQLDSVAETRPSQPTFLVSSHTPQSGDLGRYLTGLLIMTQDEEHLRLLSIFHYVMAGLTTLLGLLPVIHVAVGLAIVSGSLALPEDEKIPTQFGWFFVVLGLAFVVFNLAIASVIALAGRSLQRRRHHTFCLVVAGLSCLFMPFGTVLGVFTIIVLMRESVKELFDPRVPQVELRE